MNYFKFSIFFVHTFEIKTSGIPGNCKSGNLEIWHLSFCFKFSNKISSQALAGFSKGGNFIRKFKTYKLAIQFYHNSCNLHLKPPMKSQFQRAVLSIVLNLAEGSAKSSAKDRKKFYEISLGSLREVQTILSLIHHQRLIKEADKLGAFLYKLCKNA